MYSQIGQDEWVLKTIGEKENGVFVEIGGVLVLISLPTTGILYLPISC